MAYFSNGAEGEYLQRQCDSCPLGDKCCPVWSVQSLFNYDQMSAGQEKLREALTNLVDEKGDCQLRPLLVVALKKPCPAPPAPEERP
jgi:hypothetical protein